MRHSRLIGTALASAVTIVASAALATPANAAAFVFIGRSVTIPASFDDTETCAAYGFTMHVDLEETLMFNLTVDDNGRFIRGFVHHEIRATNTNTSNGKIGYERDSWNNTFAPDGTETLNGLNQRNYGTTGTLLLDAGRVVYDQSGNPVFVAGPHPVAIDGGSVCPTLL